MLPQHIAVLIGALGLGIALGFGGTWLVELASPPPKTKIYYCTPRSTDPKCQEAYRQFVEHGEQPFDADPDARVANP